MNRRTQDYAPVCISTADKKSVLLSTAIIPAFPQIAKALKEYQKISGRNGQMSHEVSHQKEVVVLVVQWVTERKAKINDANLCGWEDAFVKEHFDKVHQLLPAAFHLEQLDLADKLAKSLADSLKGKSPAEVASSLGIVRCISTEDLEKLKAQELSMDLLSYHN